MCQLTLAVFYQQVILIVLGECSLSAEGTRQFSSSVVSVTTLIRWLKNLEGALTKSWGSNRKRQEGGDA